MKMPQNTTLNSTGDKPVLVVTGCGGLIGDRLCERLKNEYRIFGLDLKAPPQEQPGVKWIECDLTKEQSVQAALQQVRSEAGDHIASVVHLAAYYDFAGEPSPLYEELTVKGTARMLRELQSFRVEQFIFSSSMLVMQPVEEGERIDESSPTEAKWAYPKSKLRAEEAIREGRGDIPALVLRIAGVYDGQGHSIPIGQQIKRIYERDFESHFYPGDSDHGQPFIHLDDLTEAMAHAVNRRAALPEYEVLLVSGDDLMSYGELQDRIGELLHGKDWTTIRVPKAMAKVGATAISAVSSEEQFIKPWMIDLADDHYPVDVSRAKQSLDWNPRHTLYDTLPEITQNLRADPTGWYELNKLGESPEESNG